MYKFFVPTPATLDELKAQYRKLAMMHHPDRGGNLDTMKAINNEHDALFEILKAQQNSRADADETGRTQHTTETAEEFRAVIDYLMRLDGLNIELCGCWLWISGETRKNKDALKQAGCYWSNAKKMWYWRHPENAHHHHGHHSYSMEHIRSRYGSTVYAYGHAEDEAATA